MIIHLLDRRLQPKTQSLVVKQLELFRNLVADLGLPLWHLDLVLVDDVAMVGFNEQFRGKSGVTDVLSFSYLLEGASGTCALGRGQGGAAHDLWIDPVAAGDHEDNTIQIGEIILAPDFVEQRCAERHWKLDTEFPLLVVHGSLHLLGWDHMNEEETRAMQILEQKILAVCDLAHPMLDEERLNG